MAGLVFNTSLIREKIIISDESVMMGEKDPVALMSNRIAMPLGREVIVVRGQNMHSTLRFAARLVREIRRTGPLTPHAGTFDWNDAWLETLSTYEQRYNPRNWISVYSEGRTLFTNNENAYMEVIEQCDHVSGEEYDAAIGLAEKAFAKAGKPVEISHFATVAAVINAEEAAVRCGIIHRAPDHTTTFNFVCTEGGSKPLPDHSMKVAAGYLEAINLAFIVSNLIQQSDDEDTKKTLHRQDAGRRLGRIRQEIDNFEDMLKVRYRPEKPDFFRGME